MNLKSTIVIPVVFLTFLMFVGTSNGQIKNPGDNPLLTQFIDSPEETPEQDSSKAKDVRVYLETLDALKSVPLKEQIEGWEQFLEDYPDTSFRDDIKNNIKSMQALRRAEDQEQMSQDARDMEQYNDFKKQVAPYPIDEKIKKYEEFLDTHKESAVSDLAIDDLNKLKSQENASLTKPGEVKPPTPKVTQTPVPKLIPDGEYKDPNHALFLATLPGLIVPGIGTFYAGDTTTGVVLVVVRAASLGMVGAGIFRDSTSLIVTGSIAAGFTYLVDVVAAPILARKYNEDLEKSLQKPSVMPFITTDGKGAIAGLTVNF